MRLRGPSESNRESSNSWAFVGLWSCSNADMRNLNAPTIYEPSTRARFCVSELCVYAAFSLNNPTQSTLCTHTICTLKSHRSNPRTYKNNYTTTLIHHKCTQVSRRCRVYKERFCSVQTQTNSRGAAIRTSERTSVSRSLRELPATHSNTNAAQRTRAPCLCGRRERVSEFVCACIRA